MKKLIILLFAGLSFAGSSQAQVQASIGAGSNANRINIYIRPIGALVNVTLSTLQFAVGLPATTSPVPTLTIISQPFALNGYAVDPPYVEGGFLIYQIASPNVAAGVNISAMTETLVLEAEFSATQTSNNVALITLPGAGATGNALFLSTGAAGTGNPNSVDGSLYYTRPGTTVINNLSYGGGPTSEARITAVVPLRLTTFNAVKQGNNAFLTWEVENQDANSDHFELERSFNAVNFTRIGSLPVNMNGGNTVSYNYTDANITSIRATGVIYYRLKSVDKTGSFIYSQIRSVKLNDKAIAINLYPNPAKTFTNVTFDLPEATPITINVSDASGKTVNTIEMKGLKGINQKNIDLSSYASGMYTFKIQAAGELQTISLLKQ